jgi:hypothetical protein
MKKIFTLIAVAAMAMSVNAQSTIFSWEGGADGATCTGGSVVGNGADAESVNYANSEYWTIRLSAKKANIDNDNITVTLDNALAGGETINVTGYINKDETKAASAYFLFAAGVEVETEYYEDAENIGMGGAIGTKSVTVPAGAAGVKSFKMARGKTQTNLFITKMTITGTTTGISNVKVVNVENDPVYNIAGQKVDAAYKGLVIKNGKKMIQK